MLSTHSPLSYSLPASCGVSIPLPRVTCLARLPRSSSPWTRFQAQIRSAWVSDGQRELKTPKAQSPLRNGEDKWGGSEGLSALPRGPPQGPHLVILLCHQLSGG